MDSKGATADQIISHQERVITGRKQERGRRESRREGKWALYTIFLKNVKGALVNIYTVLTIPNKMEISEEHNETKEFN